MIDMYQGKSVTIKPESNYPRIGILPVVSNIGGQSKSTDILLYVIKSRVNLKAHNFRLAIIHIFFAQKASRLIKFGFAINSDELKLIVRS
jgi:hypothetical protein